MKGPNNFQWRKKSRRENGGGMSHTKESKENDGLLTPGGETLKQKLHLERINKDDI